MGKKVKVGKARKDKFYHLAKETGYRSRAAFKLIQLNRKYEFLQRSNIIIDLCAAPGGWLQVAAENAPMSNLIIGIDLVSIPPVRNVKTFQEDITSEKCRQILKKELHTAKADCILNDGAPNVGKNWVLDAYLQAELTLYAMKLATEFLRKGGWFITKVFRSKDYDAIMWVFQQLFKNVHATKPQASRNESAEIFVVCQGYIAPDKIDPKFLDPKYVFQEIDKTQPLSIDLIHPEKKRRQREGYPEGDYTLFHSLPVTEFFDSDNYMELLAQASEVALNDETIMNHRLTTTEIKECIKDIKVLGKRDIKAIFLWRKKLKKEMEKNKESAEKKSKPENNNNVGDEEGEEAIEEMNEADMEELENLLEQKTKEELATMKKAKKKVRRAQMKQKMRIDMKMTIPGDQPDIQDDINIFDITKIRNRKQLAEVEKGDLTHMDKDDIFEDSDDENKANKKTREYFDRNEKKYIGIGENSSEEEEEMEEEPEFNNGDDVEAEKEDEEEDIEEEEDSKENANPLIVDLGETKRIRQDKQTAWFKKAAFAGLEDDVDEDLEVEQMISAGDGLTGKKRKNKNAEKKAMSAYSLPSQDINENLDSFDFTADEKYAKDSASEDTDDDKSDNDSDYGLNDFTETKKRQRKRTESEKQKKVTVGGIEVVPATTLDPNVKLDEEGLAIGAAMVQSRKRRREIVDAAYHRYMFDDDNLPDWFVMDEKRHLKRQRPVTKKEMEEYTLKMKAIDAQPIKKIAEAKARKKRKMLKRQENARKKANAVTDTVDVSEKEKWQQVKQIYKKAGLLNKAKRSITYVVTKKGAGKKVRRPAGVKGQFKVVDGRMKKDLRGQKRAESKAKGKKGGSKGGKGARGRVRR